MDQRKLQIPSGMQDTLPGECARKRQLEGQLRQLFTLQGYQEVETPILEFYDALDDRTWGYRPEDVWKTFDGAGRILAVRPDSTIPAARMAAGYPPRPGELMVSIACWTAAATAGGF